MISISASLISVIFKSLSMTTIKSDVKFRFAEAGFEPAAYGFVGRLLTDGRAGKLLKIPTIPKS